MKIIRLPAMVFVILALGISPLLLNAQQEAKKQTKKKKQAVNPAMVPIEEQPGLPRVLLIGDSISIGYTVPVRELLKGEANVLRPLTNCGPTTRGVESLDAWLGDKKWDVIHFNFGLHDVVYFADDGKTRAEPTAAGARHQVPIDQYEKNLREIVQRLKKTGATLIWCSTTPVPEGSAGRIGDESVEYNAIAAKIMNENEIAIDDLHAFALPKLKEIQLPKNVHFTPSGSKVLAEQVVASIRTALKARAAKK